MKKKLKHIWKLLKRSANRFKKDDPIRLAGTTAYFAIFGMAPIIIIITSVIGILMGQEEIQQKVFNEVNALVGEEGTGYIRDLVSNYQDTDKGIIGTIIGIAIFLITSTTFFTILQQGINHVWRIKAKPSHNFLKTLYDRLISFGLILSMGLLLLISLLIDAGIAFLEDYLEQLFPHITVVLIRIGNFLVSFGIIMFIFALIYKFLPDAHIKWKVTWTGAFITAILFTIGKLLIGLFIGQSNIGVMYGAAGSLVVILLWVFYSSIIFFFGAEITQQYAEMYAHAIEPKDYAVKVEVREVQAEKENEQ